MTDRHPTDDPELDAVPADAEDEEEAGLYEHFAVTADKGQTPMRLDKFLTVRMEHCSRNRRQREHPRQRQGGQVELQGQAARPHPDRDALPAARGGARRRGHSARHPLRGPMAAARGQTGRTGRAPGGGQLQRHAGQCADAPPQQAGNPGRRTEPRGTGAPHRQEHLGAAGDRQGRADPRAAGQTVLRPHDPAPLRGSGVGQFRRGRRDHHGQHRPQSQGSAEDVRLRRRVRRQARRDALEGAETLWLRNPRGVPSRNGAHPPDPRPHGVDRAPAVQRRTLRRRPHPQGHDLRQIPAVHRKLLRGDAAPRAARPPAGLRTPRNARKRAVRKPASGRFPVPADKMEYLHFSGKRNQRKLIAAFRSRCDKPLPREGFGVGSDLQTRQSREQHRLQEMQPKQNK